MGRIIDFEEDEVIPNGESVETMGYSGEKEVLMVSVEEIMPNRAQPRREFDYCALVELSESIKEHGIIQPIVVRKCEEMVGSVFKYELIAGERRLRACKMAGKTEIPCVLMNVGGEKSAELAIIENLHRRDLGIFETAEAIRSLIEIYGLTQEEVAKKLSVTQSAVANKLRLLKLSETERGVIIGNNLTERHARGLLRIDDLDTRGVVLRKIIGEKMNVKTAEEYIEAVLSGLEKENGEKMAFFRKIHRIDCVSAIQRVIDRLRKSGCEAKSTCTETDEFYIYTITVDKK